jgi:predicted metalloprotease
MTLYPKWNIVAAGGTTPGLSGGAIAGIVVGSVGFVAIVLTLLYFFVLKKKGFDIKNLLQKKPKRIDNLTPQKPEEPKTTESDGDNTPKE